MKKWIKHGWFNPNYPDLLIFLSGVSIGLTLQYTTIWKKLILFGIAVLFIYVAYRVRNKDKEDAETENYINK